MGSVLKGRKVMRDRERKGFRIDKSSMMSAKEREKGKDV